MIIFFSQSLFPQLAKGVSCIHLPEDIEHVSKTFFNTNIWIKNVRSKQKMKFLIQKNFNANILEIKMVKGPYRKFTFP